MSFFYKAYMYAVINSLGMSFEVIWIAVDYETGIWLTFTFHSSISKWHEGKL